MNLKQIFTLLFIAALPWAANGETVKDREGAVRGDRQKMEQDERWIYNDIERGFAEAKASGKPLLVVLRCVPCLACMGMDAAVLESEELGPLLDQFVCVRVINANTLDLKLFQFDYDLSLSTLIFNADRTLYGRYGSWQHQKDHQDTSLEGYRTALERALAVHRDYPANKTRLQGKQGVAMPFATPVDIPDLAKRYGRDLDWQGNVVKSCVHCHQIGDALRVSHRDAGKAVPLELIYPMPAPETLGLTVLADQQLTVSAVAPGSAAATAGVQVGDQLLALADQPLISVADMAWVLHHAPAVGTLDLQAQRGANLLTHQLPLTEGWREKTDISRRVATWSLRGMTAGGMVLEDLSEADREARGLAREALALRVTRVGLYGPHGLAKRAGFQAEDILVEIDGLNQRLSESQLLGRLLNDPRGKRALPAVVLRGDQRKAITLPKPE
jgi:serine protease Do